MQSWTSIHTAHFCLYAIAGSVFLLNVFGYAQDSVPSVAGSVSTIHVSSQFVILDAQVENKQTHALIGDLQLSDFRLFEDGVPQTITYFSQDRLPLSVVFLFDLTDTVRDALKPLAEGAREILGHLKPEDEVAVMVFSSHTELLQNFTTDRALAADAITKASAMESKDGTFIHESMYQAVQQAMQSTMPGSRRVTIWLTDGTANFGNSMTLKTIGKGAPARLHTKEESTTELLHSGVVVSALIDRTAATDMTMIALDANPFAMLFGGRTGDIRRYAEMTGGPVLDTSKTEIAARLAALVDQIRQRYTLGYKPSTPKPQGTFCQLRLQLNPATLKARADLHKVQVRTRQGYYRPQGREVLLTVPADLA